MNAPIQIRTADAVPALAPFLAKLTPTERRLYIALAEADGHFVSCADLVVCVDGVFRSERMRNMARYIGNLRLTLRGQTERTVVSAGTKDDLRYALIAAAQPVNEEVRRQRKVCKTVAPDGDQTIKGRITEALVAAGGRYLSVAELCRVIGCDVDPRNIATVRSRVNEIRSVLRVKGIAASVLSQGIGEALSYAWSDTIEAAAPQGPDATAEADPDAPRPTIRITLPPIGACSSCIYDGDSLVFDGVKQPRVARRP